MILMQGLKKNDAVVICNILKVCVTVEDPPFCEWIQKVNRNGEDPYPIPVVIPKGLD